MKKLYSFLGALLVATGLFAQINYTCTFSANVPMDSVQVRNTVSGETKMLYGSDNVITLQKAENQNVAIAAVGNSTFLQQTANNTVAVNVETASLLNLTLYSANGTVVARYANNVNAGQYSFQVGASAGVYVLVASANGQTASLKLSLQENAQAGIFEVATAESVAFLKSADDVITFNEGEEFEFTGYYKKQTDVKYSAITQNTTIEFEFEIEKPEIFENGAIKAGFSISETNKVYFSQGNLQYQASTGTWRFAEQQYDFVGEANKKISQTYDGWIDFFGWGTGNNPILTSSNDANYLNFTDWGVNKISNGGNAANQWRTLTNDEWEYLYSGRTDAALLRSRATVNNVPGYIFLPDNWSLPSGMSFTADANEWTTNTFSVTGWATMEENGAVFLPTTGGRNGNFVANVDAVGLYWSSTPDSSGTAFTFSFSSDSVNPWNSITRTLGVSVRLVRK